MIAIIYRRLSLTSTLLGVFLLLLASATQAAFIFTGETIGVSFDGTIPGSLSPQVIAGSDNIVAGDTDPTPDTPFIEPYDISYNNGSNIGTNVMLDSEYIDFTDTSVTFQLRGDGATHSDPSGMYQTTGFLTGSYQISLDATTFSIGNITSIDLTDVVGVSLGTEITFDAKNIYFDISTLGILETAGADIGRITLNMELVPIPAALPLMLSGLAGLALISRRRKQI
jgi:hypothetical protein